MYVDENRKEIQSNYESIFEPDIMISQNKFSLRKSSLNLDSLKEDENLLKRSSISQKDQFIKIDDWNFTENLLEIEENFKNIEERSKR